MASDTSTLRISAEATPVPTLKPAGAFLVYHTPHGKWYHTEEHCSGMLGASQYTLESAVANGKKTCSVCSAPSSELLEEPYVVWVDENQVYHVSDECADFSGKASLMTPDTAAREGCAPCERCGAAAYSPEALASLSDVSSTEETAMSTPEASASADAQQPSPSAQTGDSH